MAVTIGNFAAINDSEVDAESPITESLVTRLRDNAYWVNEGTNKTTETTATKYLKPDGSGGIEWGDTSSLGVSGTKGGGNLSSSSLSPTSIAKETNKILLLKVHNFSTATDSIDMLIDSSDDSYSMMPANGGNYYNGTMPSSYALLITGFYIRVDSGNYEFYETDSNTLKYMYIWL